MTVTCQWAVSHPAVTTRNIYSSYVGCPNNTLSLLMTLKIYLNILLYIGLNLQILSSFCRYAVSHSLGYRYATHMDKTVTMKLSRSTYFFNRYCSLHISAQKLISKFCQAAFQEIFKFTKCTYNEAVMSCYDVTAIMCVNERELSNSTFRNFIRLLVNNYPGSHKPHP